MKKYILLLFSVFAFGQASNQMVTFTQAQSLGFALKSGQSHVTSNQCMTKSDALAKYNVDADAMSSYANNQLVPRSVWVSAIVSFSGNLIVGNTSSYWGYFLGGISAGSMNPNNDISMVAGTSAVIHGLYYHRDDGTLIFHILHDLLQNFGVDGILRWAAGFGSTCIFLLEVTEKELQELM